MPIYEFICNDCWEEFEELVFNLAAIKDVKCPACGSPLVEKKISIFASRAAGGVNYSQPGGLYSSCGPSRGST
jgi:putative FmdB family regulatory protein